MSIKSHAIKLIKKGLRVFPLPPGKTTPAITFSTKSSNSIEQIQKWWRNDDSKRNIGVHTGEGMFVLDIDVHAGGDKSIIDILKKYGPLPDTYAVLTASGGAHYYFKSDLDIRNSASKLGPGIDIRGFNGFVVAEGSQREKTDKKPAGVYKAVNDLPLAEAPKWLTDLALADLPKKDAKNIPVGLNDALEDVPKGARNDRLFKEACKLRGQGWKPKAILSAINARNQSFTNPLDESEVSLIVSQASKYAPNDESFYDKEIEKIKKLKNKKRVKKSDNDDESKVIKPFNIIKSDQLYKKEIPPLNFAIDGLLSEGATLLNGRPKGGKSWLVMEIAAAVAEGCKLWDTFDSFQGNVLYLALEDGERRLKNRLSFFGNPKNIDLVIEGVERINSGLQEQLTMWCNSVDKPKLIVIDILQRVMGDKTDSSESIYKFDYNMAKALQELGHQLHVAILIVHHTRKMVTDHDIDSVSGSQGLAGAVDALMFLKTPNNGKTARLSIFSRDADSGEYDLVRCEKPNGRWEFLGERDDSEDKPTDARILAEMQVTGAMTVAELAKAIKSGRSHIQTTLTRLYNEGLVSREKDKNAYVYQLNITN